MKYKGWIRIADTFKYFTTIVNIFKQLWQNIVNIFKQLWWIISCTHVIHWAYSNYILIVDVLLLPILYPYILHAFTYYFSRAWYRNLVGHIIKFPTTFFNVLDGSVIQIYNFKKHVLLLWLFCTSKDTQPSHIITPYNIPLPHFVIFFACKYFFLLPLSVTHHSPQHPLLKL